MRISCGFGGSLVDLKGFFLDPRSKGISRDFSWISRDLRIAVRDLGRSRLLATYRSLWITLDSVGSHVDLKGFFWILGSKDISRDFSWISRDLCIGVRDLSLLTT